MTTLKFWNTEIEADTDVTKLSNETLLVYVQTVAHHVWSSGGQLEAKSDMGKFYWRVYNELIKRLNYYPVKDYPL